VTDYGGSSKEQVQEMVSVLLGLNAVVYSKDVADALAVAICHVNASRVAELVVIE
jgi:crossover junction endodeoxyribonuclease RuvC